MLIKNYKITARVCAEGSYSPFEISYELEVDPTDNLEVVKQFISQESDKVIALALQKATAISEAVTKTEVKIEQVQPQIYQQPNYQVNPTYQNTYQTEPNRGLNGMDNETLLNSQVPVSLFGKTKPKFFAQYGYSLRSCSQKELEFLANMSKNAKKLGIAPLAQEILRRGIFVKERG